MGEKNVCVVIFVWFRVKSNNLQLNIVKYLPCKALFYK